MSICDILLRTMRIRLKFSPGCMRDLCTRATLGKTLNFDLSFVRVSEDALFGYIASMDRLLITQLEYICNRTSHLSSFSALSAPVG